LKKAKKILIVDDIGFNIQALQIILKYFVKISVEVVIEKAFNGLEALEMVKNDVEEKNQG
jgi:CheY-like chemotaxis protein